MPQWHHDGAIVLMALMPPSHAERAQLAAHALPPPCLPAPVRRLRSDPRSARLTVFAL